MKATITIPQGLPGLLRKLAHEQTAAKPVRRAKKPLLADAKRDIALGRIPKPINIPESNYWLARHALALHELALAGDVDGLRAYPLAGSSGYARALIGYRELVLAVLGSSTKVAKAKSKAKPRAKARKG